MAMERPGSAGFQPAESRGLVRRFCGQDARAPRGCVPNSGHLFCLRGLCRAVLSSVIAVFSWVGWSGVITPNLPETAMTASSSYTTPWDSPERRGVRWGQVNMQLALGFAAAERRPPLLRVRADGEARGALWDRFADKLVMRPDLNRRLASWQANKEQPGLRWFKYQEGLSPILSATPCRLVRVRSLTPSPGLARRFWSQRMPDRARTPGLVAGADARENASDWRLKGGVHIHFGAEPDIAFQKDGKLAVLIDVKGGKDPAGALEFLGAVKKTCPETPVDCRNFLVVGATTSTMRGRLSEMPMAKRCAIARATGNENEWLEFLHEVFHHGLVIAPAVGPTAWQVAEVRC